jgi:hypothetical protein
VIQLVLHLHVCVDPAPAEPSAAGADYATNSAAEPLHSIADYAAEPLHSVADYDAESAAAGAAPTETS